MELAQLGLILLLFGGVCQFGAVACSEEGYKRTAQLISLIGLACWFILFAALFLNLALDQVCRHLGWREVCDLLHQIKQIRL